MPTDEKDPEITRLGERIRELRLKAGYSSAETFSYDAQVSRSVYARWEKGEDMRFSSLLRILRTLNISPEEFFKGWK